MNPAKFQKVGTPFWRASLLIISGVLLGLTAGVRGAETNQVEKTSSELKKMSVEELMDIEVTSVSRRPEKLSETASAIQVITGEQIRRSGASCRPEAQRLPGV